MSTAEQFATMADHATRIDGVAPLSEATRLALRHTDPQYLARDGDVLVGAAFVGEDDAVELLVDVDHRRAGHGRRLAEKILREHPDARFWAHGDLEPAQALAAALGLRTVRNLWRMERPVAADPKIESPTVPAGFTARSFTDEDAESWLDLNRRAFVHHPEQGRMTMADLRERMAESWWDPAGLILIFDDSTGELAASHWTKIEPGSDTGEVYVVAVDPGHQGHGLGKVVTALGLAHLADRGVGAVELYVEGDNDPAVATYRRLGFERVAADVMYAARSAAP